MKIDKNITDHIAHLARLEFSPEENRAIQDELNQIIDFVDKLNQIDTTNIAPLIYMSEEKNIYRKDEVFHPISQEEALLNAPKKDSDYFKVSKVIEKLN
jgi:aspartyl-tRNA(Asn)/glutamyl-tRNA(Gln) amidotransferase subunit C